jgi:hypothetical protein
MARIASKSMNSDDTFLIDKVSAKSFLIRSVSSTKIQRPSRWLGRMSPPNRRSIRKTTREIAFPVPFTLYTLNAIGALCSNTRVGPARKTRTRQFFANSNSWNNTAVKVRAQHKGDSEAAGISHERLACDADAAGTNLVPCAPSGPVPWIPGLASTPAVLVNRTNRSLTLGNEYRSYRRFAGFLYGVGGLIRHANEKCRRDRKLPFRTRHAPNSDKSPTVRGIFAFFRE